MAGGGPPLHIGCRVDWDLEISPLMTGSLVATPCGTCIDVPLLEGWCPAPTVVLGQTCWEFPVRRSGPRVGLAHNVAPTRHAVSGSVSVGVVSVGVVSVSVGVSVVSVMQRRQRQRRQRQSQRQRQAGYPLGLGGDVLC